jgi:hypothetical protein
VALLAEARAAPVLRALGLTVPSRRESVRVFEAALALTQLRSLELTGDPLRGSSPPRQRAKQVWLRWLAALARLPALEGLAFEDFLKYWAEACRMGQMPARRDARKGLPRLTQSSLRWRRRWGS